MTEQEIHDICKKYKIKNYIINSDGSIDVDGNVNLVKKNLKEIPLKFNRVSGYFNCSNNNLTTLEGCPKKVDGNFYCHKNELTSLEGCPKEVNGSFSCDRNNLTSFEFAPKIIRGEFSCQYNNIKSFEYFPSYVKNLWCDGNPIWEVWKLFRNTSKIELLNDFLETIGKPTVEKVKGYKNI